MRSFGVQHLQGGLQRLAARGHRRPVRALLAAAALTALGVALAGGLSLDANLVSLLPGSFQSVRDLSKLEERFGGIGWVVVVGEGADADALRRFADELAPRLEALEHIRFVDYQRPTAFFEERALYYMSAEDLDEVHRRLKRREKYERNERNPLYVRLDDEPAPAVDFSDLEEKYRDASSRRLAGEGDAYYLDPARRRVVLLAKPEGNSADLAFSRVVVDEVEGLLAAVDRSAYGPDFRIAITGTYKKKLDQQAQIARDIGVASALALALLLLYLAVHFRSAVSVAIALLPVGAGLAWTYGLVALAYGDVNLLTGFLGAILGGLGIEHGIHLLGRYSALRAEGLGGEAAARETFGETGGSVVVSALVAAVTFFSLGLSEFRAFREFGVIAGAGMLVLVAAYLAVLPAALGLADRLGWRPPAPKDLWGQRSPIARALPRLRWPVALGLGAGLLALGVNGAGVRFDYDFAALEDQRLPSFVLDRQVNQLLGYSQTPVVLLTDRPEQERAVLDELNRRKRELGSRSTIDFVGALDDLVPPDQARKREALDRIAAVLRKVNPESLDPATREKYDALERATRAPPFTRSELPASIRRQFQGEGQDESGFVLVFPAVSMADGDRIRDFAREVRGVVADGAELSAAGEPMVLADILELVTREGPTILAAAVLSVLAAMWLTLGSLWRAVLCLAPTAISILGLVGLMPLMGLRFNYLNLLVLPVLIGTTVDAGVHLLARLGNAAREDFARIYAETGRAIAGGLLTSAVGFGALLLADHPGLNSIGQLANLGFATNLLVTLLGFPALLLVLSDLRSRRGQPGKTGAQAPSTTPSPGASR